jgi:hypothetical protein
MTTMEVSDLVERKIWTQHVTYACNAVRQHPTRNYYR